MPRYPVSPEKEWELLERMAKLGIREEDIEEKFIRGAGSGGQKINKTSSCVQLTHVPSGIEVRCQSERSQALNRFLARRRLCEKVAELIEGEKSKRQQEIEKIRRQKRRRSRRAKEKMLDEKKHRGKLKEQRKKVREDDV
ncbi:MAG: peptide chain release factor-like protein [Candidatus Dadabacteria bacterium]|nr:MAG: peptide chain release factor-like protein [Candidatus Dadabacteria bacterium]